MVIIWYSVHGFTGGHYSKADFPYSLSLNHCTGGVVVGSQTEGVVHHGREGMATGA